MADDMGRGITAPSSEDDISSSGVAEMRTLGATTAAAINDVDNRKLSKTEAYEKLLPREEAEEAIDNARHYRGDIPRGSDLNQFHQSGHWSVSRTSISETLLNWPEQIEGQSGHLEVFGAPNGFTVQQVSNRNMRLYRVVDGVSAGAWSDWYVVWERFPEPQEPVEPSSGGSVFPAHTARQTMFTQAMGGRVKTNGKAAVAFRIDHGLRNFADHLLPLFQTHNIVPGIAINPRDWHRTENDGITPSDLNSWVDQGLVEVINHGADHLDAQTDEEIYDKIVNGLTEIEQQLPAAQGKVWGFVAPGIGTGGYGGFGGGSSPENWDTLAGRLILKHHAVTFAHLPGTMTRPLMGQIRQGLSHFSLDRSDAATSITRIDTAISRAWGLQFMIHPSLLDTSTGMSLQEFSDILDYVVDKRANDEIVTLSPYELILADSG